MLLEQRAAQHSLGRQPLATGLLETMPAQVPRHQPEQITMLIQPLRHRLQFTADLVFGEKIEYTAWTVRSWRIVGSGGYGFVFRISRLI
jgi:hypothetical protein